MTPGTRVRKFTRSTLLAVDDKTHIPTIVQIRDSLAPALRRAGARKAVVFGSYARGNADRYSDLDIIIVHDTDKGFFDRSSDFREVRSAWPRSLDMLIYTPDELDEMLAQCRPFIETALEEGVVIYEA